MEAGMPPDDLATRLGKRSKSIVYRLENEDQEPDVATINALVAALPLSAEELLRAMGVSLNPPATEKPPEKSRGFFVARPVTQRRNGARSLVARPGVQPGGVEFMRLASLPCSILAPRS